MSVHRPRSCGSRWPAVVAGVALAALLAGCASRGNVAPPAELVSSGWRDPSALSPAADFDAYVAGVERELRTHRLPFDPSMADAELRLVAACRLPPAPRCATGKPRGVAILVHGLADTAFAMRDLAESLSRQCLESRVLLLPAGWENDFIVIGGFSLGVALGLTVATGENDEVVDVAANRRLFEDNAVDPRSILVNCYSDPPKGPIGARVTWLPAAHDPSRLVGLSHLSLHISPDNPRYGVTGTCRNCGSPPFGQEDEVRACKPAQRVWYGVGGPSPPAGEAGARSTFNPHYPDLERRIGEFLDRAAARRQAAAPGPLLPIPTPRRPHGTT